MNKAIFLHSLFRAGSTYLFNKFRVNQNSWPFYEPLHHDLIRLREDKLDIWQFNKTVANIMSHPELDKPHFFEYQFAFNNYDKQLPYYDQSFAYNNYSNCPDSLKNYIDNLVSSTPASSLPVLQFNRTSLRLDWFKQFYPDVLHVFLLRDPCDQFESYVQRGQVGENIFLALNLMIIGFNKKMFKGLECEPYFDESVDMQSNIQSAMEQSRGYTLAQHFEFFLHVWFLSLSQAYNSSTFILNMDKMNTSSVYQANVNKVFSEYDSKAVLFFDDYSIKKYTKHSIASHLAQAKLLKVCAGYITKLGLKGNFLVLRYFLALGISGFCLGVCKYVYRRVKRVISKG